MADLEGRYALEAARYGNSHNVCVLPSWARDVSNTT
jgi:hypothetical protein